MGGIRLILIDTHVWIWIHSQPERLSKKAIETLQNEDRLAMSTVSIYETIVAVEKGRLASQFEPETLIRRWLSAWDISRIPVSEEIAIHGRTLKFEHADPFDRLIGATAFCEKLPILTSDRNLLNLNWLTGVPAE
jgi:PIN domain nuclease of toxin-antitoxin system